MAAYAKDKAAAVDITDAAASEQPMSAKRPPETPRWVSATDVPGLIGGYSAGDSDGAPPGAGGRAGGRAPELVSRKSVGRGAGGYNPVPRPTGGWQGHDPPATPTRSPRLLGP